MYNSTIKPKRGQCVDCPEGSSEKYLTAGRCSYHYKIHRSNVNGGPKKIANRSKKGQKEDRQYTIKRLRFLAQPGNQRCFIEECNKRADTVEHTRGRKGYADDWAKENGITLYLDERFWKPCCLDHNLELETNSELSEKYQISKISGKQKIIKR
ncbi:hypothetical protein [Chryseobacterium mucoviscidosis]|uniref:hypothetical protein n=1 Tax=Chryseobacterium mucoviscidosis TaxID=1945581 RepID=UPI003016321C